MEDQQLYKANLSANSSDNVFYQHIQCQANNQALNHSYDSVDLNESMSPSPHLSLDTRDATLPTRAKNLGPVDSAGQTNWSQSGSGNHIEGRSHLNSYDQNLQWSSQAQNETADAYQATYYCQMGDNRPKVTSGALHKLDSFTQVFARHNLRIQSSSQGIHEQPSLMDSDSALRQLLSFKSTSEQQTHPNTIDRYQQAPQQMQSSLANQQQKHLLQTMQHSQQNFYYDYPQHVNEMQQEQQFVQQMQTQQVLTQQSQQMHQPQYYMQSLHSGQQHVPLHEMHQSQQQRQFSGQLPQYYQTQAAAAEIPHSMQQTQHHNMQLQSQTYHRDRSQKADHYAQDQSHPMQLIQLGAVPHYVYQNSQPFSNLNKQSMIQQQLQEDASPQKTYHSEGQSHAIMDTTVGLTNADMLDNYNREDMSAMQNPVTQHPVLIHDASYLANHPSSNTAWPQQMPDDHPLTMSPEHSRGLYPEKPDSKTRLPCLICLKEFRTLPALNGHLKSHGGVRSSPILKQDEGEKEEISEVDSLTPIVMPVSVPVKLAPSEPNCSTDMDQPESCVSDEEMPILTRMTYSPPSHPKAVSSCASSDIIRKLQQAGTKSNHPGEILKTQSEKRKYQHRPEPLFIPPPSFNINASYSGATLYQSQLRSPRVIGDHSILGMQELPLYTPPPMLSPARQGSGLFNSVITASHNGHLPLTPLTPTPRVLLCQSNSFKEGSTPITPGPGEKTIDVEPRINIGPRFQAEIPKIKGLSSLEKEQHKATLVWKPWADLETRESQQKVDVFLSMSCSSVMPGGGTNLEYALHTLFQANGNILTALEMLLLEKSPELKSHSLTNYHYAGSDKWTSAEKKNFNKALNTCSKDFFHVQKMIKSKTVSQCVEYYYTWKKIIRMGRRQRTRLPEVNEEDTTSVDDIEEDEDLEERKCEEDVEQVLKSPEPLQTADLNQPVVQNLGPPIGSFICEMGNCGAVFCSRQALNGHARVHGGTNVPARILTVTPTSRQKSSTPSGHCSMKSSPAHSTTSGETDAATIFPCKVCGKVFLKIKSRNAHMKTHRQQEEQQRQKAQKAAVAAEMADAIARNIDRNMPAEHSLLPFDHLSLIKTIEQDFDDDDVAQDLEDVLEETEVMHSDLLLDDEDVDLLQDGADL
ncbi:transcriptional-regulating factor 1 isoform X1 [Pelobates fuscus]|uniref:transcriptional-regulating factor 1 isoform X1 n=1 Tax=Pelobates fuscus TaxID=191477 RepID=UPI002FE47C70